MLKNSAHDLDALAAHVSAQRWFGAKSSGVEHAELADVIPVTWRGVTQPFAVARARIATGGRPALYQLFLTGTEPKLEDALQNERFLRGLANAFVEGATFESADGRLRWVIAHEGTPVVVPSSETVRLSPTEQTNSSVFIGGVAILKLYRKLEAGVHPDVEVTRFLTHERRFAHVPALFGTIRFEGASGTEATIAGMLQELVPGAVDGWTYALKVSAPHFDASAPSATGLLPFEEQARQLGGVTRELHEALASGAPRSPFAPRAATAADVRSWTRAAAAMLERSFASLQQGADANRLEQRAAPIAAQVLSQRARYARWIGGLASGIAADAGAVARTHGDYHLGQVLRSSADRFLVIDFEGEPARPLAERRAPQSPLRDVAGMLRSFSYAGAVSASRGSAKDAAERATRWERAVRGAFLDGYFGAAFESSALHPRAPANTRGLTALFEAEKLFYELQYELDHRPDWVWIPLQGITQLDV